MYHAGWALGGQHALQGNQARRLALRRHAQPDGGALAGEDQARHDAAPAVPPRQRHRADDLRDRRHHAAARRERHSSRTRSTASAWPTRSATRTAKGRKTTQYFEIMGSRAIYHDGWMASAFGPREPWATGTPPGIREWTPDKDKWELYNVDEDWSQANDLADQNAGEARGSETALSDRSDEEQGAAHRRRPLDTRHASGAAHFNAVQGVDLRGKHDPDAGVRRTGPRQQGQSGYDRRRDPR